MSQRSPFQDFIQTFREVSTLSIPFQTSDNAEKLHGTIVDKLLTNTTLDTQKVAHYLSNLLGMRYLDLETIDIQKIPQDLIKTTVVHQYSILPLWKKHNRVYVGMSNPCQQSVIEILRFHTQKPIVVLLVDQKQLDKARQIFFARENLAISSNQKILTNDTALSDISTTYSDDIPLVHYLNELLKTAIQQTASDVHLEPYGNQLRVRFRIDGLLRTQPLVPANLSSRLLSRIKVMAQLDIAERRKAQSGHFTFTFSEYSNTVDCRISTCPTQYGEKIAIRLLDQTQVSFKLDRLGLNKNQHKVLLNLLKKKEGLILVTGPTGSGKTMTLYSILQYLNQETLNISTAEDPIEIYLPGINQISIQPKIGLNFEVALKTFLRQDPDIIMFGEMRDLKTAEISIQAAQTGHLILSTIHTKNALETVTRLSNMGIPHYEIANSIRLIVAQRLVRKLCHLCKETFTLSPKEALSYYVEIPCDIIAFKAKGCSNCIQGYRGRIGIFELLPFDTTMSRLVLENQSTMQMLQHHTLKDFFSLKEAAFEKLKEGVTSLEEIAYIFLE